MSFSRISAANIFVSAALVGTGMASTAQAQQANMTFFVTSSGKGNGADLGGLEGADAHCNALAKAAGAAFVKTSTGFGPGGATVEDVSLMRQIVGDDVGVKASGGVRTAADARRMIAAGANRLGTSASVAIVSEAGSTGGGY